MNYEEDVCDCGFDEDEPGPICGHRKTCPRYVKTPEPIVPAKPSYEELESQVRELTRLREGLRELAERMEWQANTARENLKTIGTPAKIYAQIYGASQQLETDAGEIRALLSQSSDVGSSTEAKS